MARYAILTGLLLVAAGCTSKQEPIQPDPRKPSSGGSIGSPGVAVDAGSQGDGEAAPQDAAVQDAQQRDAPEGKCPSGERGPEMTMIDGPQGTRYCIDRTEVTQGQYKQFVDAVGARPALRASGRPGTVPAARAVVPG
jgi:hypothetical protein